MLSIFFSCYLQAQINNNYQTQIDTISIKGDSVLANVFSYRNDTLISQYTGYLFPETIKFAKYRIFKKVFKSEYHVLRAVLHGKEIIYKHDGKKAITNYLNDSAINTTYYDQKNQEIKYQIYNDNKISFICTKRIGTIIILGKVKR